MKRKSILDPYKDLIEAHAQQGATYKVIEEVIYSKGYRGSTSPIRNYLSNRKKDKIDRDIERKQIQYEYIERSKLIKLLFHKVDKVKGLTEEILTKVYSKDSIFKQVIKLIESFRNLMKHKKIEKLDGWISKAKALNIA